MSPPNKVSSCIGTVNDDGTGITLTADQKATLNISLHVGQAQQTVQVSSNAIMLETTSAALGQVINSKSINELPLNGRNPGALTFVVPGGTNGSARPLNP